MAVVPGGASEQGDWPAKVADAVEGLVVTARTRSVRPLATAARIVAFSILALAMLLLLAAALSITVVRILDIYAFSHHQQYLSYVVTGGIFALAGVFLFTLRTSRR
jgi:hypothetical protein